MLIEKTVRDNRIIILLPPEFNYKLQRKFREIYEQSPVDGVFVIDFKQVDFIDSSTIGMLLLLREYCGNEDSNITFINCAETVQALFESAHFEELFNFA